MISNWIYAVTIWFAKIGYLGIFLACLGIFPAEIVIAMVGAGMPHHLLQIAGVAALGEAVGAFPTYLIGYFFSGKDLLHFLKHKGKFLNISEDSYNKSFTSINKNGIVYIFLSRFLPQIRIAAALVAGYVRYDFFYVFIGTAAGTFIYAYAFAYLGSQVGLNWEEIKNIIDKFNDVMTIFSILLVIVFLFFKLRKKKIKN